MEAQGRVARPPNDWQIKVVYCSSCDRPTITVEEGRGSSRRLVTAYPRVHGRDPIAAEVPDPYKSDYEEACAVLPISPQSAAALAEDNISANVVAAYFHDHVFVPEENADAALAALRNLSDRC